jgi:hypothetical protein
MSRDFWNSVQIQLTFALEVVKKKKGSKDEATHNPNAAPFPFD